VNLLKQQVYKYLSCFIEGCECHAQKTNKQNKKNRDVYTANLNKLVELKKFEVISYIKMFKLRNSKFK